jgi:hypothetical protein
MPGKSQSEKKKEKEQRERRLQERNSGEAIEVEVVDEDTGQPIERPADAPPPVVTPRPAPPAKTPKLSKEERELQKRIEQEARELRLLEKQAELSIILRRKQALLDASQEVLAAPLRQSPPPAQAVTPEASTARPSVSQNLTQRLEQVANVEDEEVGDAAHRESMRLVNLDLLRKAAGIREQVDARLQDLGLGAVPELDTGDNTVRGKKIVSGKLTKVENNILKPVLWPHAVIDPKFCSKLPTYDELDYPLLVAGELAIALNPSTPQAEVKNRLNLLKLLSYCHKLCPWQTVKQFHSSALTEVERGTRKWTDDKYSEITTGVLLVSANASTQVAHAAAGATPHLPYSTTGYMQGQNQSFRGRRAQGPRRQQQRGAYRYFCKDFNRGTCSHNNAHRALIGSREQWVEHFCATCWLNYNEVAMHAETTDCPRYKAPK